MIGFITDQPTADTILAAIKQAQVDRGYPHYWSTGSYPIHTGDHAGAVFIPASDEILSTPLRPDTTPMDYPECQQLIDLMGGLEARVDLDPEAIIDPNAETL